MSSDETRTHEENDGFEYDGRFYRWHVSDMGKDLMLIDRFAGMSVLDFFEVVDDEDERARGPILLTLIATSIRHGNPNWSVERVTRTVMNLSLSEVEFVGGDEEEGEADPPGLEPADQPAPTDEHSRSQLNGSSSSSTREESETSKRSSASPA